MYLCIFIYHFDSQVLNNVYETLYSNIPKIQTYKKNWKHFIHLNPYLQPRPSFTSPHPHSSQISSHVLPPNNLINSKLNSFEALFCIYYASFRQKRRIIHKQTFWLKKCKELLVPAQTKLENSSHCNTRIYRLNISFCYIEFAVNPAPTVIFKKARHIFFTLKWLCKCDEFMVLPDASLKYWLDKLLCCGFMRRKRQL